MNNSKVGKSLEKQLNSEIIKKFTDFLPDLIEVYLDTYDENLNSIVTNKDSLANPEYFYDDYAQALEEFEYIDIQDNELIIRIPTEDTFNFKGRLRFIELLLQGVAGKYLELSQIDYDSLKINKDIDDKIKRAIRELPSFYDTNTPKELRFYLIHTRSSLYKSIESILGKNLVEFPFSNSAPRYLFDEGIKFFESNIDKLLNTVIDDSIKVVKGSI